MRALLGIILSLNLSHGNLASAQAMHMPNKDLVLEVGKKYGSRRAIPREILNKIRSNTVFEKTETAIGHQGQALLLMWILSGVAIVKHEAEQAKIENRHLSTKDVLQKSGEAADYLIKSGEVWSGLLGGSGAGAILKKPMLALNELIKNKDSRPILKNLIQSGIATSVTFLGWEFLSELYAESVFLIDNDTDRERAEYLMPLLVSSIKNGLGSSSAQVTNDRRILSLVLQNMLKILVYDHDLRNLWLLNTWRNQITSGEFVTLVTSMVTATAVGTTVFPGYGTIVGFMFGLTGGVLSLYIPQDQKDTITVKIKNLRRSFLNLGDDLGPLFSHRETVLKIMSNVIVNGQETPPALVYNFDDVASTNGKVSITFELLYFYESRLQTIMANMQSAYKHGNIAKCKELKPVANELLKTYLEEVKILKSTYSDYTQHLKSLLAQYPAINLDDPNLINKYSILNDVRRDLTRLERLASFFNDFADLIRTQIVAAEKDYSESLTRFFLYGYDESMLYELLKKADESNY